MTRMARLLAKHKGDTFWALLDQGAAVVSSTLSFMLLGRTLGATGYGAWVGLYALIGPFLAPTQSGVLLAAMEHVVRDREDPVEVARSCLSMTLLNALLCVPVLSGVGLRWIEGIPALAGFLLVGTEFFLNGILAACVGMVQALTGFSAAVRLRIAGVLSRIGLLTVLAIAHSLTLTTLAVGQVATLGVVAAFAITRLSRLLRVPARPGRIQLQHVRSVFLYGLGIAASNAQSDADKFVLTAAHYQADAGRYGAAYRLMQVVQLPVNALVGATHLSFLHTQAGPNAQSQRAIRLSLIAMTYAVPAVICLVLMAPLVPRILTRDFAEATLILQLLSPVVILRGVGIFPMNGLLGLGHNVLRVKLLVGNALFSLALYAAFIPKYSWRGALAATLVSETTLCASSWIALFLCERDRSTRASPEHPAREAAVGASLNELGVTEVTKVRPEP
jgi:O-antigen/teichoic acid export membrane protein